MIFDTYTVFDTDFQFLFCTNVTNVFEENKYKDKEQTQFCGTLAH